MNANSWFHRLSPRPDAAMRLICFHHAGGSASLYRLWPRALPEFDVCAVQLPGRANRLGEPPLDRLSAIVEALVPHVLPLLDRRYALFGHSMGTAVATCLARRLRELGAPLPDHLFASGRQPPHLQYPDWTVRGKNDAQLLAAVEAAFGGLPPEIATHPELIELVLPALRADLEAMEAMSTEMPEALPVPITAIGGTNDPYARKEHLQAWQACTDRGLTVLHLPGGHFYLDDELTALAALLRRTLTTGAGEPARRAA